MHFVIDNVSCLSEINGIDDLVVSIFFIAIEVLSLTSVTSKLLAEVTMDSKRRNSPE
jgi:hypothetical protein